MRNSHLPALLVLLVASLATVSISTPSRGCFPFGRTIQPGAPFTAEFPYLYAVADGQSSSLQGNTSVPAPGDKAHEYQNPLPGAYRGNCPGLNVMANYGFISRDGVSSFDELVAAQQNMYNFGYDISVIFAAAGVGLDGDLSTELLSIGGNATCAGVVAAGLDAYGTLESDSSLTRTDYKVSAIGDNWSLNLTLWQQMVETMQSTSSVDDPQFDAVGMAKFVDLRYNQSKAENPAYKFGAQNILYYATSAVAYELFQGQGKPDLPTLSLIYGANKTANGNWTYVPERLPKGWRNRSRPLGLRGTMEQIYYMYTKFYKLAGHNEGVGNFIVDEFQFPPNGSVTDLTCFIYDTFTSRGRPYPSPVPVDRLRWITNRINPHFSREGCQVLEL